MKEGNQTIQRRTSYLWARILHRKLSDAPYFVSNYLQQTVHGILGKSKSKNFSVIPGQFQC